MPFPLFLVLAFAGAASMIPARDKTPLPLIPRPASLSRLEGTFRVTPETKILWDGAEKEARQGAKALARLLEGPLGKKFRLFSAKGQGPRAGTILFTTGGAPAGLGQEGYTLEIRPERILVKARGGAGFFYAVQTIRQLLPPAVETGKPFPGRALPLPCLVIRDKPRFAWRGFLLDVGRHFFTVDQVCRLLDEMALHKLNTFHWHLTEDQGWRIEIKKYPRLTEIGSKRAETPLPSNRRKGDGKPCGGFYTQKEIERVVAYAAALHIRVLPEIEMPGHCQAALAAYPELSCTGGPFQVSTHWGVHKDVYCAGKEKTFQFLEGVLDEVMKLFPFEYIHIGGDECPKVRWKHCPLCQARIKKLGLKNENELQSWFIRRIEKYINSKGKRIIGWDEILEGGLAPNAAVMSWRGVKGGIAAARASHYVVMSPNTHCYLDYYQSRDRAHEPPAIGGFLPLEKVYSYEPVPPNLSPSRTKYILGVQGNIWTEYIPTFRQVEYMAWPRGCALAEVGWSPAKGKDLGDFKARLEKHVKRLSLMKVRFRPLH